MAICSSCGHVGTRIRSVLDEQGRLSSDKCPHCAPSEFQKFTMPSDQKIWMGYEAHPEQYEKRYDRDGVIYVRKPEYRAEQEEQLRQETEEERTNRLAKEAKKRAERRTAPMDQTELAQALQVANLYANAFMQGHLA